MHLAQSQKSSATSAWDHGHFLSPMMNKAPPLKRATFRGPILNKNKPDHIIRLVAL